MKAGRFTNVQIMAVLKQAKGDVQNPALCRKHGMGSVRFYKRQAMFGGVERVAYRRNEGDGLESRRLKRMYAEMSRQNDLLKEPLGKSYKAVSATRGGRKRGRTARR